MIRFEVYKSCLQLIVTLADCEGETTLSFNLGVGSNEIALALATLLKKRIDDAFEINLHNAYFHGYADGRGKQRKLKFGQLPYCLSDNEMLHSDFPKE